MDSIDRIDRKILAALQRDGRITNAALATEVALSPSACLARVRRLEAMGVITGYGAQVAIEKLRSALLIYGEVTLKRHLPEDFRAAWRSLVPEIEKANPGLPTQHHVALAQRAARDRFPHLADA